jgi:predicted nucleic acid-binding protein
MTQFVVDACVAIKWVIPETQSEDAAKLLSPDHILICLKLLSFAGLRIFKVAKNAWWLSRVSAADGTFCAART